MFIAWEKFHSATVALARSGPIKQRLFNAYVNHLATLDAEQMPRELREDFGGLTRAMHAVRPLPGEDAVRATIRKMSDGDANRHAVQIVNMFCTVARSQSGPRAVPSAVVQLYAAEG
ncbi:MAG TPA: hypothetical protein VEZ88_11975 [Steroidobacteraceae bacterium]|nr:hypothetical protein [Steroidobacteraceae bacterium]